MTSRSLPAARSLASATAALALTIAGLTAAAADPVEGTGDGTYDAQLLEVVIDTDGEPTDGHVLIEADGGVTEVRGRALDEIPSGSTVEATVSDGVVKAATVIAPVAQTVAVSTHKAYVVTIDDATRSGDVPIETAVADAQYALDYWVREGRGAISSFDVAQQRTLALAGSCAYGFDDLWQEAAELFPSVDFTSRANHLIVYTPTACSGSYGYLGVATIGRMAVGGYVHMAEPSEAAITHEVGHNLGLGHSDLLWGDVFGAYGFAEYYGAYSPMAGALGAYEPASLDAAYRTYLDLPGADAQTETITLTAGDSEPRVVTLDKSTSTSGTTAVAFTDDYGFQYFVDYRDGAGTDAAAFYASADAILNPLAGYLASYRPGVVVTLMERGYNEQYVLGQEDGDGNVQTSFHAGDAYTDPLGQFALDVVSTTAGTATVSLVAGPATPTTTKATATTVRYGTASKVTVTVNGSRTPHGKVTVTATGFKRTKDLVNGKATFTMPKTWKPGTRTLTVAYKGSLASAPSKATLKATVTRATPKVSLASTSAVKKGAKADFVVKVASGVAPEYGYAQLFVGTKAVSSKVKLWKSGSIYKTRLTSWKLPAGRISVKYYGNTYLKARKVATSIYAR
ncbi:hypothetical protein [Demequina maris]|uniref:hypothetical protein n=1 Tax=Demequina maris TaxID=1638982 RepID=UPI0007837AD9|nr:hypothetical protein [Demequina maris]